MMRVGFLGLGLMGRPMARNLIAAGFDVTVWNRTRARAEEIGAAGASIAETPRQAALHADFVLTIVSDPPALEGVALGPDGAISGLRPGAVFVDSSTVSPDLARRLAGACEARGGSFLDAPVTGGTWGAEKGELIFLVGGEAAILERAKPLLAPLGKHVFLLGPHGAGQTVKLAMNMILALQVEALAEAMALVRGAGLAAERLVEVLQASMARAAVLDLKAPMMLQGEFEPSFPLRLMHKDLGLALDLAGSNGVALPATTAARRVYGEVCGRGGLDVDYAAVARFWEK